jgi:hypothetical protein
MTIKIKKWHIATAVAIVAIVILLAVLFGRKRENLTPCPPVPPGDILTSYTQDTSNCTVTCQTADPNATVARDPSGACRSTCKPGYVKSATTGACTISTQVSSAVIDNMKLDMMNMSDPKMKAQLSNQIAAMEAQLKASSSPARMA